MIVWRDGKMMGILVDWDLCKYKEMLEKTTIGNGNRLVGLIPHSPLRALT